MKTCVKSYLFEYFGKNAAVPRILIYTEQRMRFSRHGDLHNGVVFNIFQFLVVKFDIFRNDIPEIGFVPFFRETRIGRIDLFQRIVEFF